MQFNEFKFKIFIIFMILSIKSFQNKLKYTKKRVGVIGLAHSQNVGNNLLKYAIFIKLSELGFCPFIVGKIFKKHNISFISNHVNIRLIRKFSDINENEFDILMVNSDQTWTKYNFDFYDVAFLRFAENWKKKKFTYGVSLGSEKWVYSKKDERIAKHLLNKFTGLSVREKSSIALIEIHLGFKPQLVLDPTFLINKKYYISLIKNFKSELINPLDKDNFIFSYILTKSRNIEEYLLHVKKNLNIKICELNIFNKNQVEEFLNGIYHCKAIITDSYHGTVFSIIFKKPFITFMNINSVFSDPNRFKSLGEIINIKNRIFDLNSFPPISLLKLPLVINDKKLITLKKESINYLKKNLMMNSKSCI